jgi:PadR family transcriptional regulator PadR
MITRGDIEMLRDFFLGFVKIHILYHATREPVFGLDLIRELERHGYQLSPGTLYPILHNLEEFGYLRREEQVVNGKVRKYYVATPRGQRALAEARRQIAELVAEVFEESDSPALAPSSKNRKTSTRKSKESVMA